MDNRDKQRKNKLAGQTEEVQRAGWNAISEECGRVYPGKLLKHYGTLLKWQLGGKDPLDGIDLYDGGDYWHFVSYGMSELYEKESEYPEISGFGMEFTFRLKKDNYENEKGELMCICGILQSLARLSYTQGEIFYPWEYVYTGQTQGIDVQTKSNITGFITVPDSKFRTLDTPNGKVQFVEFIGATDRELLAIQQGETTVEELFARLGSEVTDYNRESLY